MFVNHLHIDGTYSHGLDQKRLSTKGEAVSQIRLLKNRLGYFHLAEKEKQLGKRNLTFLIV